MKQKDMSPRSIFLLSDMEDCSILHIFRKNSSPLKLSSFFILILIITHDIKLFRKCETLFVFPSRDKILNTTCISQNHDNGSNTKQTTTLSLPSLPSSG